MTIRVDPAEQNQTQSQDELTNPNPSNTMDTRDNDKVPILGSEGVAKRIIDNNVNLPYITTRV